jgi:hypothetical protein
MRYLIILISFLTAARLSAEMRKWTSNDGKVIEAEFVRAENTSAVLKLKDGRVLPVELNRLSQADQDFVKQQGGSVAVKAEKRGPSFDEVTLDKSTWKMRETPDDFGIKDVSMPEQFETPHFVIIGDSKVKKAIIESYAEVNERLYAHVVRDFKFLESKFKDRKVATWLVSNKSDYILFGKQVAEVSKSSDNWDSGDTVWLWFKSEITEPHKIFPESRAFCIEYEPTEHRDLRSNNRIHFTTSQLLGCSKHTYGKTNWSLGFFDLSYCYYVENEITGKIETKVIYGDNTNTVEGFKNSKTWPATLKKVITNTPFKPSLDVFLSIDVSRAEPNTVASGFALVNFIFSDPVKREALAKIIEVADQNEGAPSPEEFAKAMGAPSVEAFDQQWLEFIMSDQFK